MTPALSPAYSRGVGVVDLVVDRAAESVNLPVAARVVPSLPPINPEPSMPTRMLLSVTSVETLR